MRRTMLLAAAVLAGLAAAPAQSGSSRLGACLHGPNESSEQNARRDRAVRVAQAINAAEVVTVGPMKPRYRRPEELANIPALPQGFVLHFTSDGSGYAFSIKDTLDPCQFAIFSDQDKLVYSGTPVAGVRLMPVETR